ncbi:MAG: glycosyltransferase family 2 protein [Lachnospiraceae bacterium]|nr:glycosyltransferase family 2 protein [Lachnospiraceae bacterium]
MRVEVLVSCLNADVKSLVSKMKLDSDAVIVNQCGREDEEQFALSCGMEENGRNGSFCCVEENERSEGCSDIEKIDETASPCGRIRVCCSTERGVGRSRNLAMSKAEREFCIFSDEDIVYRKGYGLAIAEEFDRHPEADGLLFQVEVDPARKTYQNDQFGPVGLLNCGRYPAYSMAFRREKLLQSGVRFSTLFGGGARYSNGEDSLFIRDVLKAGLKLYKTPVCIGEEVPRPSTWFTGYHEKFFFDRGVLYHFLYGWAAPLWAFRFVFTKRKLMCQEIPWRKALGLVCRGIREGRRVEREEGDEA